MYKQLIIARKDLNMSAGKLAAQVSHGSIAFLISRIRKSANFKENNINASIDFTSGEYVQWIRDAQTKVVLGAKNKTQLLKAKTVAEELGLEEDRDFFLIYDLCRTELEPEGSEGTLTVIGFKPLDAEVADKIGKKYQLWR
jgi:PTH2 family peptidyl-tRNA hydrolase